MLYTADFCLLGCAPFLIKLPVFYDDVECVLGVSAGVSVCVIIYFIFFPVFCHQVHATRMTGSAQSAL